MTNNEVTEIERIWELEYSRNPTFRDYRKVDSSDIEELGMKQFLERVLKDLKSVILLINYNSDIREKLTEDVATKKLRFSDCILLFNPNMGLVLRSI